jgi:hypothetical protein
MGCSFPLFLHRSQGRTPTTSAATRDKQQCSHCSSGTGSRQPEQERRVQATGTVRPAPSGSRIPLLPRRGATSRLARSGEQRSGAPHEVLGLDGEPPDGRVPRAVAWADGTLATRRRVHTGAEGGTKRPITLALQCACPRRSALLGLTRRAREALTPSARAGSKGRGGNHGPLM